MPANILLEIKISMKKSVRLLSTVLLSSLAGWANASPTIEVGTRVWVSEGETEWSHCASIGCGGSQVGTYTSGGITYPIYMGDPTSKLNYSGIKATTLEVYADIKSNRYVTALKLGMGDGSSGSQRDQDWFSIPGFASQYEFSDTTSQIKSSDVNYWVADFGYDLDVSSLSKDTSLVPFVGYFNYKEKLSAFGLMPVSDGDYNLASAVSSSTKVFENEVEWSGVRLGVDLKKSITDKLSGTLNIAYVITDVNNKDSHVLRTSSSDLGAAPNIISSGDGDGVMLDIILDYDYSDALAFDFGYRMWNFDADNAVTKFGPDFSPSYPSRSLFSKRDGFMLGASYRF